MIFFPFPDKVTISKTEFWSLSVLVGSNSGLIYELS